MAKKRAPRKTVAKQIEPAQQVPSDDATRFPALEVPDARKLSDEERVAQTQFKPFNPPKKAGE